MTFTDVSSMSSDPSLYLLKVPIQALATLQGMAGYVGAQAAVDDPSMMLVQIVPSSAADQYIRQ
jgi:hypothetical protein